MILDPRDYPINFGLDVEDSGRSALGAVQPVADLFNNPGAVYSIGELFSNYSQEPQNHAEKVEQPAMTLKKKSFFHAGYLAIPVIIMASQASSRTFRKASDGCQ